MKPPTHDAACGHWRAGACDCAEGGAGTADAYWAGYRKGLDCIKAAMRVADEALDERGSDENRPSVEWVDAFWAALKAMEGGT